MILSPNTPDNLYREQIKKIKQQIDNEKDVHKKLKLKEQLTMPNLFSFTNSCYGKYKNPW